MSDTPPSNESQKPLDFDLRDRIAKAIATRGITDREAHWDGLGHDLRATYLADADAVIAELGLIMDTTCHIHDREGKQRCRRYITDWEADV